MPGTAGHETKRGWIYLPGAAEISGALAVLMLSSVRGALKIERGQAFRKILLYSQSNWPQVDPIDISPRHCALPLPASQSVR